MRGNRFALVVGTLVIVLSAAQRVAARSPTEPPIDHVIVIFQENVSDHWQSIPNADKRPLRASVQCSARNANGQRTDGSTGHQ
jgi:hypothetical protein